MQLSPGSIVGVYEVIAHLGTGGMGEVWRARDSRLGRDVALKVLPESVARDPERLARFEREARVLASLNHPNIAALYGLEGTALVMELVEGMPLDQRIAQGAIPLDEALEIAQQIADGLDAAHAKGIIHRDLKPANVKLTPEGRVKVLDFGLAKAAEPGTGGGDPAQSPTITVSPTGQGVILGTAGYMAPEQARGSAADRRADIWAFGVVVYEMVTGQRLFGGETITDTLASVLTKEPEWRRVPRKVRRLLQQCLQRDPRNRLRDIGDMRLLLTDDVHEIHKAGRPLAWIALASMMAFSTAVLGWVAWRATRPVEKPLVRLDVNLGPGVPALGGITLSPDGSKIACIRVRQDGKQQLSVRALDQEQELPLPGTEGAVAPFFSPDGQWLGFGLNDKLMRVRISGGTIEKITDLGGASLSSASWGDDGHIVAALKPAALVRVPVNGGAVQHFSMPEDRRPFNHYVSPQALPGSKTILFTLMTSYSAGEKPRVVGMQVGVPGAKTLVEDALIANYLESGHLLFVDSRGEAHAVAFDPERLELQGRPVSIFNGVRVYRRESASFAQVSAARNGTVVYRQGAVSAAKATIQWMDRQGRLSLFVSDAAEFQRPYPSPDGRQLAVAIDDGARSQIWIYSPDRGVKRKLTIDQESSGSPVWSVDGRLIMFNSGDAIYWVRADGSGSAHRLLTGTLPVPRHLAAEGKALLYTESGARGNRDLWILALEGTKESPAAGKAEPLLQTSANEMHPVISPDGRWLAYKSDDSGREEVYVKPVRGGTERWLVSDRGGTYPLWASNSRELLYRTVDGQVMSVPYRIEADTFSPEKARPWCDRRIPLLIGDGDYFVAPDGKRIGILIPEEIEREAGQLTFLLNFFDEVRRKLAAGK